MMDPHPWYSDLDRLDPRTQQLTEQEMNDILSVWIVLAQARERIRAQNLLGEKPGK